MHLVKPLSRDKGSGRYTMYLPLSPQGMCKAKRADTLRICPFPLVPREGLYQIHGQSLNTHRGKHRSGGAFTVETTEALGEAGSWRFFVSGQEVLHGWQQRPESWEQKNQ